MTISAADIARRARFKTTSARVDLESGIRGVIDTFAGYYGYHGKWLSIADRRKRLRRAIKLQRKAHSSTRSGPQLGSGDRLEITPRGGQLEVLVKHSDGSTTKAPKKDTRTKRSRKVKAEHAFATLSPAVKRSAHIYGVPESDPLRWLTYAEIGLPPARRGRPPADEAGDQITHAVVLSYCAARAIDDSDGAAGKADPAAVLARLPSSFSRRRAVANDGPLTDSRALVLILGLVFEAVGIRPRPDPAASLTRLVARLHKFSK